MKAKYFTTEFGDVIEMDPKVEEQLYPRSMKGPQYYAKRLGHISNYNKGLDFKANDSEPGSAVRIDSIRNDIYTLGLLLDEMEKRRVIPDDGFNACLDIGGCEGVHAAIMRGLYARCAEVADIMNGEDPFLTLKLLRELYKLLPVYLADRHVLSSDVLTNTLKRLVGRDARRILARKTNAKYRDAVSIDNYYHFLFKRIPKVDRFIVGDWFESVTSRYDLIINFQCFWLWDHRVTIKKIAELLEDGGIFGTVAPYCWAGRSSLDGGYLLGGQFGYFEQRLTLDDIKEYYRAFKPEVAEYVDAAYHVVDPNRPTIRDYIDEGRKNGLILEGYSRVYDNIRYDLVSSRGNGRILYKSERRHRPDDRALRFDVDEILGNIHRFRPEVQLEDLMTRAVVMVFRKA